MFLAGAGDDLQRRRSPGAHGRVESVELFFDLVFVFAVTRLSQALLEDFTPAGFLGTAVLMIAIWWAWIDTCWVTNWMDPQRSLVRLLLFALMLAGLIISVAIPEAFGEAGAILAVAYVALQLGRSLFMIWALRRHNPVNCLNFTRIFCWQALAALFWLAGAAAGGEPRLALWAIAIAIESAAPAAGFWTPGLGRSTTGEWDVEGGHIAERCGLFVIIALGESVLVTGQTFATAGWSLPALAAFAVAFAGTVAMWWIYFNIGADYAGRVIARSADPGRIARLGYTYLHIVIVAGIILSAVADEMVLVHPLGDVGTAMAVAVIGGSALYLLGNLLFKWSIFGRPPLSHLVGLGLLALQLALVPAVPPLALAAATNATLALVAIWEMLSLRSIRAGSEPEPHHG